MKLYYCKYPEGRQNFGDALNVWLWEQLLDGILDDDPSSVFVGIGTLLNDALPTRTSNAKQRIIFSTGAGYEKQALSLDESYHIYCLRGPISAQILGVDPGLAITDGALLLRKVIDLNPLPKKYKFSYMPHYDFAGDGWQNACDQQGFGYISPAWDLTQVITSIRETEVLICEAMHGAIVADALRVPWIPAKTHPAILALKWQDWCASVGLEYHPQALGYLYQPRSSQGGWAKGDASTSVVDWVVSPAKQVRDWWRQRKAGQELSELANRATPCLSSDVCLERLTTRLEEALERFKQDYRQGKFQG
ncbi:polysaccharide pyruvyl transferase family protein [Oscillatoria acuminata]|uniref:Polysaccharide pyruvyl transferase n=1 Tax=Oscillatoria acuminata PCC 6304 TaxID=56110 RepID=K9TH09_9CYAN|nr:polysaccharide pyruvyl transferase family protein [Oscillatoria acuminata]AFY81284.1 Polysaccharide pyruvyl transferase [Oscillatoria acuminata PCC 6304]